MVPLQWKACNILFSFLKRQDKSCKHSSGFVVSGTLCVALTCPSHPLPGNRSAFLLPGPAERSSCGQRFPSCSSLAHCHYGWSGSFLRLVCSALVLRDTFGREILVQTYQHAADLNFNITSNVIIVSFSKRVMRSFHLKANLQNLKQMPQIAGLRNVSFFHSALKRTADVLSQQGMLGAMRVSV